MTDEKPSQWVGLINRLWISLGFSIGSWSVVGSDNVTFVNWRQLWIKKAIPPPNAYSISILPYGHWSMNLKNSCSFILRPLQFSCMIWKISVEWRSWWVYVYRWRVTPPQILKTSTCHRWISHSTLRNTNQQYQENLLKKELNNQMCALAKIPWRRTSSSIQKRLMNFHKGVNYNHINKHRLYYFPFLHYRKLFINNVSQVWPRIIAALNRARNEVQKL